MSYPERCGMGPLWKVMHGTGEHRGHVQQVFDHGGTDVTYMFVTHCARTLMVSGSLLKASGLAKPEDKDCPHV